MQIEVRRDTRTANSVTSLVTVDDRVMFVGLEPHNPIQAGEYECWLRWSKHNRRWVIAVMDVPGHSNIEVHIGNKSADTIDCLLIGLTRQVDYIAGSSDAFAHLLAMVVQCVADDERVTIKFVDLYEAEHVQRATA